MKAAVLRCDGSLRDIERGGGVDERAEARYQDILVIQRDTVQTAKLVASSDQASTGRLIFGIVTSVWHG